MKIVLLGVQLASLVRFRASLMRELCARGHDLVVIAPEPEPYWQEQLQQIGARYICAPLSRTGLNPLTDAFLLFWLLKTLRMLRPDVLFCFQAKAVIYGLLAAALAGVRRRIAMIEGLGQGFVTQNGGWQRRLVRLMVPLLYRLSLRCAHKVVFLNPDDEAEFLERQLVQPGQSVRISGIGVDLDYFSLTPLPQGPLVFVMLARLLADKGVREYLAAARLVRARHPGVTCYLLGPPDDSHAGVPLAEVQSCPDVRYEGEVRDVRPWLARAHVFVLPTAYREGLPMSGMEALAMGRFIITTDSPGARELLWPDRRNGILIKPRNINELTEAMLKSVDLQDVLAQKGAQSRELAEQRYDAARINRGVAALITGEADEP